MTLAISSRVRLTEAAKAKNPDLAGLIGIAVDFGGGAIKVRWTHNPPAKAFLDIHAWHKPADIEAADVP
jgi:hypothetical protein